MRKILLNESKISNERGSLLLISFFVVLVLLGISSVFMLLATSELRLVERQRLETAAFNMAEAGIERAIYDLRLDFENDTSAHPWMSGDINGTAISFSNTIDYEDFHSNVNFYDGTYTTSINRVSDDDVWVRAVGVVGGVSSTIEAYVKIKDNNPWAYAIFAGTGQTGSLINGNVDIRGAVLILGDNLADGAYAADIGGTAEFVGNNYRTLDPVLKAKVPPLKTVVVNGETVETLEATLRVKKGIVGVSGDSSIGEVNLDGNAYKEQVDGVYVTDGFGGTQGAANVYSDNGTNQAYDKGDSLSFPTLSDPYTDSSGNTHASYQSYLKTNGYTLTASDLNNINTLPDSSFSFGDVNGGVSWDGSGNLQIDGIVYIDGGNDLNWTNKATSITYSGKGSFFVTGNVSIGTNIVTSGNLSFPNNIIGIMTPNNINLGGNSHLDVMGMFYAEGSVIVDKQTDVVGSIVSNYFDFGTNVPALYQVPSAKDSLPDGMIGKSIRWYEVVAWIKR